jgi:anti-anti-sigma factor
MIFEKRQNRIKLKGIAKMTIQNFSENVLFVDLSAKEPQIGNQLKDLNETVLSKSDCDVVIDFFRVEIINSSSLGNLMILHNLLKEHGHQLVFCSVAVMTKYIFTVTGLDKVFNFADDRAAALSALQCAEQTKEK